MILKPQDIVVMLKLVVRNSSEWSYPALSYELSMSASEVHAGVKRAVAARLMDMHRKIPVKSNLLEFLIHGVKYAYPPDHGGPTRGIATSYAAQPLKTLIMQPEEPPPVWPDPQGPVRGYEFSPLYSSVPQACKVDPKLYELLALLDAIRDGRARERKIAIKEIQSRISS
ncbi:MAG: hypothetical protein P8X68_22335 [Desulfobacterales bacterium]|jgi:hypothetical protein